MKVTEPTRPDSGHEIDVDVVFADPDWRQAIDGVETVCRQAACLAFATGGGRGAAAVCLALADDATVRDLNRRFRGRDAPTNVLAFPAGPAVAGDAGSSQRMPRWLGDVVIARQTLLREAEAAGVAPADHLRHLTVHGMLHLLGYDHHSEEDADAMERLETMTLSALGVADPYGSASASGE